jgi:AraC-like DNA-binding protein
VSTRPIVTRAKLHFQRSKARREAWAGESGKLLLETGSGNLTADQLLGSSLIELADKLGCKPRDLNRRFQRRFGMSLVALRMELRLLKAAALLRESNARVEEIAEVCGFGHVGLFGICFERRFEATPMQWRQRRNGVEKGWGSA